MTSNKTHKLYQFSEKQVKEAIIGNKLRNSRRQITPNPADYDTDFYIRQSTPKQMSIPKQKKTLSNWADKMGWAYDPTRSFFYDIQSGANLNRKGYEELKADIKRGKRKRLVLLSTSRAARSTLISAELEELLRDKEMEFWIWEEKRQFNLYTGADRTLLGFKSLIDEITRRNIIRATKWGMYQNAKRGYWQAGKPPYGYLCKDKKHLIIDTEKARIVQQIFRELETKTYSQLAVELNSKDKNIPSPEGRKWTIGTIAKIVHNRVYLGEIHYGDAESVKDAHDAIVSIEQWNRTHETIKLRRNNKNKFGISQRNHNDISLYTPLLYCGKCGRPIKKIKRVRHNKDGSIKVYIWYGCGTLRCPNRYLSLKEVEEAIYEYLCRIARDKQRRKVLFENHWERLKKANCERELSDIDKSISQCEEKIEFIKTTWGNRIEKDELARKRIKHYQEKMQSLGAERSHIETVLKSLENKATTKKKFYNVLRKPAKIWGDMSSEEKIYFISKVFERITYLSRNEILKGGQKDGNHKSERRKTCNREARQGQTKRWHGISNHFNPS